MKTVIEKLHGIKAELAKWERGGSLTMVNRDAHYQSLMAVKDHILTSVAAMVKDMAPEEVKKIPIAGCELTIRKQMNDMYSGVIRRGNQNIHEFDRTTIPQIAGQIQSLLELYGQDVEAKESPDALIEKLKPLAEQNEKGMVSQLISMLAAQAPAVAVQSPEDAQKEIMELILEANFITEEAKRRMQSVDPRTEISDLKRRVEETLKRFESLISVLAPTSQDSDLLHNTLHQFQQKHDLLTERVEQELNIIHERLKAATEKLDNTKKTITITVV